ncbi:MAG: ABC transporter ATP-binding protein, partial [Lachnospiraceae bacterium]|nr:ABC transporter ATP-binding protein [Lachnospiraceae bacterium]
MIKVNNLNKYYNKGKKNEQHVLNNINLEFGNTGLVCILGESGSGKTTLLNTIGGIDDFADGTLQIGDAVFKSYKQKQVEPVRNDHFGYIFQNYYLLKDYSVNYNVKIALNRYNLSEKEKDERTKYILDMLGMGKYRNKPVSKLSGGQQQRVSIARALVKAPDIILADEPTGNLDEENTIRTMAILKKISRECLVLLVTHEKRIARFFGDRIIEIRDGRVVRDENNTASTYERSDDLNICSLYTS